MVYATQVELSWLPPDPQLWNGRITNYTVVYELLGPVGMMSANSSHPIMTKTIPAPGNPLANNADPRRASVPLQQEMVVVDDLQEDHVYKFSVFMTNAAGRSGISMSIIQALLGAGRVVDIVHSFFSLFVCFTHDEAPTQMNFIHLTHCKLIIRVYMHIDFLARSALHLNTFGNTAKILCF